MEINLLVYLHETADFEKEGKKERKNRTKPNNAVP